MHKEEEPMKKTLVILIVFMLVMACFILPISEALFVERHTTPCTTGGLTYFTMSEIAELGQAAWGVSTADFNNDGWMDFVVGSATAPFTHSTISIFYNDGIGGFTQQDVFSFGAYFDSLTAGDFNNDGAIDLLFGFSESKPGESYAYYGTVNILFNDGNNNFDTPVLVIKQGSGKRDPFGRINPKLSAGDYDLDGDLDFILGDNSGKIELFINDGSGIFTSAGIIHDWGRLSWGVTSADFDSDGDVDFLVSSDGRGRPYVSSVYLKLNRQTTHNLVPIFSKGPGELIASSGVLYGSLTSLDYENDGDMDFIAGEITGLYLYINDEGFYCPCPIINLPDYEDLHMGAVASADFNNDGHTDFVAGGTQGIVRLFTNNNDQPFGAMITKPRERHLTVSDKTLPFPVLKRTVATGKTTIEAHAFGEVTKVDFYVNEKLEFSDTEPPYTWVLDTHSLRQITLKIVSWDAFGNSAWDILQVWRFQQ